MKIAVIDSGINKAHPIFKNISISGNGIMRNENGGYTVTNNYSDSLGHGTAVCGILAKNTFINELYVCKIYNNHLETDVDTLIFALKYINDYIECDLINLSLGTNIYNSELELICNELFSKNIFIISAFDNAGGISYPAAFKNVLGVDTALECTKTDDFIIVKNSPINILAKGGYHRLAWVNPSYIINQGSSFSCAYITSIIAKIKSQNSNYNYVLSNLEKTAKNIISVPNTTPPKALFKIKNAAVVPFRKEEKSIFNFEDLLSFKIQGYYDIFPLMSGKKIFTNIFGKSMELKNYLDIDWINIDTLIIGHLHELSTYLKRNIKKELFEYCLKYNKNVVCFDDELVHEYKSKFDSQNLNLFYPNKSKYEIGLKAKKMYTISVPVLGVFGTSTKQGKFTLQLSLRKKFKEMNYSIGQIGTEPSSLLFEMDECFPFGYDSSVKTKGIETVELLNQIMWKIDKKNVDLILVGCQSGTIPNLYNNIEQIHVEQLEFLLGTNPDIVILCINLFDDLGYIRRTKNVIEELIDAKVIAFGISPLIYPNNWEIMGGEKILSSNAELSSFREKIEKIFNIPTYVIGDDKDMYHLATHCIEILSE